MDTHITIFVDTNIVLHFPPLAQMDWLELLQAKSAKIILAPIVISELDKHKNSDNNTRKKRAKRALGEFSTLLETDEKVFIRDNVELAYEHSEPVEFITYRLDPTQPDDRLLATILKYSADNPGEKITLVSNDMGCRLKARGKGIHTYIMPEERKLPDEPDPDQVKLRALERELAVIRAASPKILLSFADESLRTEYIVPNHVELPNTLKPLDELQGSDRYAKIKAFPNMLDALSTAIPIFSRIKISEQRRAIEKQITEQYNACLDKYFEAYANYYNRAAALHISNRHPIMLNLIIQNMGGTPAEDVDIEFLFPDGDLELSDNAGRLEAPKPPTPPKWIDTNDANALLWRYTTYDPHKSNPGNFLMEKFRIRITTKEPNRHKQENDGLTIVNANQPKVIYKLKMLKHNTTHRIPMIRVIPYLGSYKSFSFEYCIYVANMPKTIRGNLSVIKR